MIKMLSTATLVFAGATLISLAQPAFGQSDDKKLGTVHFETSCKPEAQKLFDQRDAVSALVLVPRVAKSVRGCAEGRSRVRHRLLGHRAQPAVESPRRRRRQRTSPRALPRSRRERPSAPRPSASATISMRSAPCTPTTTRSITARACRPTPRPWNNWRSAIPTMTRRRSTMRSPSTPRRRRPTRPTPTSSRARRSWSRSQNASRSIPAWRIT